MYDFTNHGHYNPCFASRTTSLEVHSNPRSAIDNSPPGKPLILAFQDLACLPWVPQPVSRFVCRASLELLFALSEVESGLQGGRPNFPYQLG